MFESQLSQNIGVFLIGILIIFVGLFVAKKMNVFQNLRLTKSDRELLEKTKRVFGMGGSPNPSGGEGQ